MNEVISDTNLFFLFFSVTRPPLPTFSNTVRIPPSHPLLFLSLDTLPRTPARSSPSIPLANTPSQLADVSANLSANITQFGSSAGHVFGPDYILPLKKLASIRAAFNNINYNTPNYTKGIPFSLQLCFYSLDGNGMYVIPSKVLLLTSLSLP